MIWSRSWNFTEGEIQIPRYRNGRAEPKNLEKKFPDLGSLRGGLIYKFQMYILFDLVLVFQHLPPLKSVLNLQQTTILIRS